MQIPWWLRWPVAFSAAAVLLLAGYGVLVEDARRTADDHTAFFVWGDAVAEAPVESEVVNGYRVVDDGWTPLWVFGMALIGAGWLVVVLAVRAWEGERINRWGRLPGLR